MEKGSKVSPTCSTNFLEECIHFSSTFYVKLISSGLSVEKKLIYYQNFNNGNFSKLFQFEIIPKKEFKRIIVEINNTNIKITGNFWSPKIGWYGSYWKIIKKNDETGMKEYFPNIIQFLK